MRKVSIKNRRLTAALKPLREAYKQEMRECAKCGEYAILSVHEILRGRLRQRSKQYRECWLVLCQVCHPIVQDWPLARQLKLKLKVDPEWLDLDKIREVYGGGVLVTMADIRAETIQ